MSSICASLEKVLNRFNKFAMIFSAFLMILMVLNIVIDVAATNFLGESFEGTVEVVSRYYMVALVFLPLAYVQSIEGHIVAGIFTERASERTRLVLKCLSLVIMCAFGTLLAWRCGIDALRMTSLNEQIQTANYFIPTWPSRWIPVFAGAHIAVQSIISILISVNRILEIHFSRASKSTRKNVDERCSGKLEKVSINRNEAAL